MEEDNTRYERSTEMFSEAQNKQMEQTNAILAGFKDIFKDSVKIIIKTVSVSKRTTLTLCISVLNLSKLPIGGLKNCK